MQLNECFEKLMSANYYCQVGWEVIWLLLNNNYTSQNYKYRASSSLEVTHMYSSHQNKKIWLVISYQTPLFRSQSKVRILWVNFTELTLFLHSVNQNCTAVIPLESSNFVIISIIAKLNEWWTALNHLIMSVPSHTVGIWFLQKHNFRLSVKMVQMYQLQHNKRIKCKIVQSKPGTAVPWSWCCTQDKCCFHLRQPTCCDYEKKNKKIQHLLQLCQKRRLISKIMVSILKWQTMYSIQNSPNMVAATHQKVSFFSRPWHPAQSHPISAKQFAYIIKVLCNLMGTHW